jgi:hypothetical protein
VQLVSDLLGIGSTFVRQVDPTLDGSPPWSAWARWSLFQSGGQALRWLSHAMWDEGRRAILMPGYLCETMIVPFSDHPWHMTFYRYDDQLRPVLDDFKEQVVAPDEQVALVAEYFGRLLSEAWQAELDEQMSAGLRVVEDRTHRVFDSEQPRAHYSIASLRKTLPVGDGGVLSGAHVAEGLVDQPGPGDMYWEAMDLKSAAESQADIDEANVMFRQAESDFERQLTPARASTRTRLALGHLDYEGFAKRRSQNATVLTAHLDEAGVDVVAGTDAAVPSHVVVRANEPKQVQRALADLGIYCPIHWPRPPQVPSTLAWIDDVISLPIDHRYSERDMEHVAKAFVAVAHG